MDDAQLALFRAQLIALRDELAATAEAAEEAARPVELDQTLMGRLSRMDAMQGQEMAKANQQRRQLQAKRIEVALQRIEDGDYGLCRQCDEAIDPRRLAFDPTTLLCLACASANESQ